jgi:hypothetical protein
MHPLTWRRMRMSLRLQGHSKDNKTPLVLMRGRGRRMRSAISVAKSEERSDSVAKNKRIARSKGDRHPWPQTAIKTAAQNRRADAVHEQGSSNWVAVAAMVLGSNEYTMS